MPLRPRAPRKTLTEGHPLVWSGLSSPSGRSERTECSADKAPFASESKGEESLPLAGAAQARETGDVINGRHGGAAGLDIKCYGTRAQAKKIVTTCDLYEPAAHRRQRRKHKFKAGPSKRGRSGWLSGLLQDQGSCAT